MSYSQSLKNVHFPLSFEESRKYSKLKKLNSYQQLISHPNSILNQILQIQHSLKLPNCLDAAGAMKPIQGGIFQISARCRCFLLCWSPSRLNRNYEKKTFKVTLWHLSWSARVSLGIMAGFGISRIDVILFCFRISKL